MQIPKSAGQSRYNLLLSSLILLSVLVQSATTRAAVRTIYIREASVIETEEFEELSATVLPSPAGWNPANGAFDNQSNTWFFFDGASNELLAIPAGTDGRPERARLRRIEVGHVGLRTVQGMAFDPATNHLYLLDPVEHALYELTTAGQLIAVGDLSAFSLVNPQGMLLAPSRDLTDDPAQLNLYVADSGRGDQIVELLLDEAPPAPLPAANAPATLIQTIHTSQFSPPSPDPAGVVYLPHRGTLLISDGEVNEMPIFTGDNLFEASLSGTLVDTLTTFPFSDEPVGIDVNPANKHLFISDDTGTRSVYELNPGPDGFYDTSDDSFTSFRTADFGSNDPEGLAYDPGSGVLFIADGVNREVYRVHPGANGIFDGVDDQVSSFDTLRLDLNDPEGIAFNPGTSTLYAVGDPADTLFELTTEGSLVRRIDISAANARKPAGLALGPGSQNPGEMSIYIADRGVDNDSNPNENDGKIYEFSLGIQNSTPTNTPTPTATASPTATATASPTPTATASPTATATASPTPTATASPTPTATGTKVPSPSPSPTATGPAAPGAEQITLFFPVVMQH